MKKNNLTSNLNIYKSLNGSIDVSDAQYIQINSIIKNANNGNWKPLKTCNDILILAEILFIWLDDCVKACIFPGTIQDLFNNNTKLFSNNFYFIDLISDFRKLDMKTIIQMYEFMKNVLKKYEWENFKFFSNFLRDIYPIFTNNKNELKNEYIEYKRMIEKIAIFILGYNIDFLYENEEENNSFDLEIMNSEKGKYFQIVQMTILILKFLRDTSTRKTSFEEEFIGMIDVNKLLTFDSVLNSNENKENFVEKILNSNNRSLEQEKDLFNIYQKLKNHFEKIPNLSVSDDYLNNVLKNQVKYDEKSDYNTFKIHIQECERESISSSGIYNKSHVISNLNSSNVINHNNNNYKLTINTISNEKGNDSKMSNSNYSKLCDNPNLIKLELEPVEEDNKKVKNNGIINKKNLKIDYPQKRQLNLTYKPSFQTQILSKKLKKISFFIENEKETSQKEKIERRSEISNIPHSYLFINGNPNFHKKRSTAILKFFERNNTFGKNVSQKEIFQFPKTLINTYQEYQPSKTLILTNKH